MNRDTGVVVLLLMVPGLLAAACSGQTDGGEARRILFVSNRDGNMEIYAMKSDGTDQQRLTDAPEHDYRPSWSPDGAMIVFASRRGGTNRADIYVMNRDGTNQTRLTTDPGDDESPCWSPDGSKIAFTSARDGTNPDIFIMNADGTFQVNATNTPDSGEYSPAWSPDGSKIAFESSLDSSSLYVMDPDGTHVAALGGAGAFPAWSPDGSKIAFTYGPDIYIMNANGTLRANATKSDVFENYDPTWSSDGNQIVFFRRADAGDSQEQIYVMNADGTSPANLSNGAANDSYPSWY